IGGKVEKTTDRNYESEDIEVKNDSGLFEGMRESQTVWLSQGDKVVQAPDAFHDDATSQATPIAVMIDKEQQMNDFQFQPEVSHREHGVKPLENFVKDICQCKGNWTIENFIESEVEKIQQQVGNKNVLCALSGGVDSSVVAALVHKAIGNQLTCIFVDH